MKHNYIIYKVQNTFTGNSHWRQQNQLAIANGHIQSQNTKSAIVFKKDFNLW
jgi:hypothetical protein